jgi:uncharacterized protein YkwD
MLVRRVVALAAAALVLAPAAGAAGLTRSEGSILREMNRVRAAHGLRALRFDGRLERASRFHSTTMIRTDTFTHGAFGARMQQFSIRGSLAGENLAWGTGRRATPSGIVGAWLASPAHRANLLRASFTRVGVGAVVGPFSGVGGATVVTADFAG